MKIQLHVNESLLREGLANLERGWEAVGGRLFLTNRRLYFQSHNLNVQKGSTEIPLNDIKAITPCWTKFLGRIPLFPNSLSIHTQSDVEYRFVLNRRQEWATDINQQISKLQNLS
jgi:GRAM domain